MDGVHPLGVWNGGGVLLLPAQCGGVARALFIPLQCWRVLLSCRVVFFAGCHGVWVVVCVCAVRVVGYPLSAPPSSWWWVGPSWMVGGIMDGGWHSEGRAAVLLTPVECWCPRLCVGVPLVVYPVALLNGGSGVCCDALSSGWVRAPCIVLLPFALSSPPLRSLSQHCWFGVVSL